MSLTSAGVDVTIIDDSFYFPGDNTTVPLIFIATADEKTQADGVTPALGTYEHGVIREVTSIKQSLELYGIPRFLTSADGEAHHGDARNEYGLDALNKYLEIGNRALVVRANVNLADDLASVKSLWASKIDDSADYLGTLVANYIEEYNTINNLFPPDAGYKETVTASELKSLVPDAMETTFASYSFSSETFKNAFLRDHTIDHPGYQEALFDTSGGFIQGTDITGLNDDITTYGFEVEIVDNGGTTVVTVSVAGQDVQTFSELVTELESQIQAATTDNQTTVEILQGNIRITSGLDGATSSVEFLNDGPSGTEPLWANVSLFEEFGPTISGEGINTLDVYNDSFTTVVDGYDGLYSDIDTWTNGGTVANEFTPDEADSILVSSSTVFDNTNEFVSGASLGANDAARRTAIVTQLQAVINTPNNNVRSDRYEYNVTVTPGYHECVDEMVRLSQDMREEVFVIGETPFDKPPTGPNGMSNWATSSEKVSSYHVAYYYPHGISSNIDGEDIMTTASSTALRVFAVNDLQAEPWFAPAGVSRGTTPHLSKIGYVSGVLGGPTNFVEDNIDRGTRDSLYNDLRKINPITLIPGRGKMVLGQKTSYGANSALDRVNVSRLVKFIKRMLRKGLFPYLFEPNDEFTRDEVKVTADGALGDLLDRRGLYDFATLCDESNNTPVRIDRNELWIDVAIKPIKAVEFIYVPVRVVNTGDDI